MIRSKCLLLIRLMSLLLIRLPNPLKCLWSLLRHHLRCHRTFLLRSRQNRLMYHLTLLDPNPDPDYHYLMIHYLMTQTR